MKKAFLKWAGGKQQVLRYLLPLLSSGKRLIEPFVGSAVVSLSSDYQRYLLADNNADLINVYLQLKTEGVKFINYCQTFFTPETNAEEQYYEYRTLFNEIQDVRLKSALFIYLNRHGYNGLCRYNSKGKYNVPFGSYKTPSLQVDAMRYFYQRSKQMKFIHADFVETMRKARKGDVLYCDPPYVPLSKTATFTAYSKNIFGENQQVRLAEEARRLSAKAIPVIISNHNTPFTQEIYRGAELVTFDIKRSISCDTANRKSASELLAVFT